MSLGFRAWRLSQEKPHLSIVPGRKFSTSTSAFSHSLRTISCPSGEEMLQVMDFLLRLASFHHSETPSFWEAKFLNESPRGCSTLMTSAPKSAM